ncbi:MAG: tetratricopeptide repeat protein, partial [Pseudomonadales bacterium]
MKLTNLNIFSRKSKTLPASKHSGQKRHLLISSYFIGLLISLASITGCGDKGAIDQKSVARHIKQSQAYLSQGQFRAANIEARNAIQKNPDNIHGHIALGDILNELGRYKKSIELLEQLPETARQNNAFLYTLLKAYMGRGKYVSAADLLQKNTALMRQQQPQYSLALAALYQAQDNLSGAEDIYHQLLNQAPDSVDALLGLIHIKYQQADLYSAESLISRVQVIAPLNPDIDFIKAKISMDKKQYGEAETLLTEAISNLPNADVMTPRKSAFLQLLSETLTIEGKTTEAIIYTQKIAEAFPGAEIAQGDFRDASVLFEQGEFQQAETLLEKLVAEYPNFEDAAVLLGIIKYRAGDIN